MELSLSRSPEYVLHMSCEIVALACSLGCREALFTIYIIFVVVGAETALVLKSCSVQVEPMFLQQR